MPSDGPHDICFGPFRLDRRKRVLLRDGTSISLGGRAFDVLTALALAGGETLNKELLLDQVWPGVTVEENNLQVHMVALRKALGVGWITTIPGRGYRLMTTLTNVGTLADDGKPAIVVLPFANLSGDPDQEYFVDGMVEDITTRLSRVRSLVVIARNSAFTYKGRAIDIRQVGRELGVGYLLEGSVQKTGSRVRITSQLADAVTGTHRWADRFDGTLDDVFAFQDQVTASVVAAIEPTMRSAEIVRARRKPAENLQAYDLMLRALPRFYTFTRDGLEEASRLLRSAIEIDPAYALALVYLAGCQWAAVGQNWVERSNPAASEMVHLVQAALALGSDDPEVLRIAGPIIAFAGGDLSGGIALIEKAIELNPNDSDAMARAGMLYAYAGDKQSAIVFLERSIRLDPLGRSVGFHFGYVLAHFVTNEHEAVVEWTARALREQPNIVPMLRYRAASLGLLGRLEEGREVVRRLLEYVPDFTVARARWHIEFDMNNIFRTPGIADSLYEGLRRSGVPE